MSDHDLLMRMHDRLMQCATKADIKEISQNVGYDCVREHEKRFHSSDSNPDISITAKGNPKLMAAVVSIITAAAVSLLAKFGISI